MRQSRFSISKKTRGKNTIYRISIPAYLSPTGKKEDRYYPTRVEAERARGELLASTRSESKVATLSNAQITDAVRAYGRLAEAGISMTLDKAIELALTTLRAAGSHISINSVFSDFAEVKAPEWRPKSRQNFRYASAAFLADFSGRSVASISGKEITLWLNSHYDNPTTRAAVLRTIRPAFSYAVQQELIPSSPFQRVVKPRITHRDGVDVFTPEEARRLMETAPPDCKAAFAILLFAGVRPTELTRLKWGDIRDGYIHITPSIAKTAQVRNIDIEPTLAAWLEHRGAPDALICPPNWKRKNQATRREAGLANRADTARHSYASYHLATYKDVSTLKMNMGHSRGSDVLFAHYRAAATPETAAEYWNILP